MSNRFTATLLRTSASGFASMAVSRAFERSGQVDEAGADFAAWQAHFRALVLELAAAVDDGCGEDFAGRIAWARDAFTARGLRTEFLHTGLEELGAVLEESLPPEAWAPTAAFLAEARRELERAVAPAAEPAAPPDPLAELAAAFLDRIRAGEAVAAIDQVASAVEQGRLSAGDALEGVLTRALREIGRLWHADRLGIAEEHFATQTAGRLIERLVTTAARPRPNGRAVVLAMVDGDAHDLGLRIVGALFELDGWRTICLGANTPAEDLALAARQFGADLVVVGATLNTQREAAARAIETLRALRPDQKVLVGGPAFTDHGGRAGELGADGVALTPSATVQLGRELVGL